mmetsp:Transcript_14244/g.35997  ORF Transcript_14244/g.35997 Transcript_14244/m.35997 type:complete len:122 (-) Transcript_14244:516-881(-)
MTLTGQRDQVDLEKIRVFTEECNDLYLAQGPSKEFILDICGQGNEACFEDPGSRRVSCCCAMNPLANFGEGRQHQVDGITKFEEAWVAGDSERCGECDCLLRWFPFAALVRRPLLVVLLLA